MLTRTEARAVLVQPLTDLTLGALGELVCRWASWTDAGRTDDVELLRSWARGHRPLRQAWKAFRRTPAAISALSFNQSSFEVRPVPSRQELLEESWQQFLERFSDVLVRNGFPSRLARALSGAFGEMADNVVSHSAPDGNDPAPGIVAFHIEPRWMAYAVADTGRGVLNSLKSAERWAHLSNASEALLLAVTERATRRDHPQGSGYQTVIEALAERQGFLRFRSDDAKLELRGTATTLSPRGGPVTFLRGLQLVIYCALEGASPGERWLAHDF